MPTPTNGIIGKSGKVALEISTNRSLNVTRKVGLVGVKPRPCVDDDEVGVNREQLLCSDNGS